VALIAGGIGIAPLFQLLVELDARAGKSARGLVHLYYGARTAGELLSPEAFSGLGISVHFSTDDGTRGRAGTVAALCFEHMEQEPVEPKMIFACGPLAMQVHLARWALTRNIPAQLSLESLMACGIGACLGCALPAPHPDDPAAEHYIHVCSDGPIFPAGAIQWSRIQSQQIHVPTFLYS
jgi:dihydroorotate dehydrogenase electron transfer subunit